MEIIVNSKQMKACDDNTVELFHIHPLVLMERAALSVEQVLEKENIDCSEVLIVAGTGNNGGDGFALARLLYQKGYRITVVCIGSQDRFSTQAKCQYLSLTSYGIQVYKEIPKKNYSLIIDGMFGTGLSRPIEGTALDCIEIMNQCKGYKVAIDIPSGINGDDGSVMGTAFKSDLTISFAYTKIGTILYPGVEYAGKIIVTDIGITRESFLSKKPNFFAYERSDLKLLPQRPVNGNKGTFGKVLVIAGSEEIPGAALMCAHAAFVSGCGMVKVLTSRSNRSFLASSLPEALISCYDDSEFQEESLKEALQWPDVIVIGPGIGTGALSKKIVKVVMENAKIPLVIDADALNVVSKKMELLNNEHQNWIITPHLGEMSRLCQKNIQYIQNHIIQVAEEFAKEYNVICILKDFRTIISVPSGETYINRTGNDGMATAGSGDVLSGLIGGLIASGCEPKTAAPLSVFCHGLAGDLAKNDNGNRGMLASDMIQEFKAVIKEIT
ncbi:MAG: NAD(P)H-hydrate dehydratase [Lachnospiraceae bacterium]